MMLDALVAGATTLMVLLGVLALALAAFGGADA